MLPVLRNDVYFRPALLKQPAINQPVHLHGRYATELVNNLILSSSRGTPSTGIGGGGGRVNGRLPSSPLDFSLIRTVRKFNEIT